MKATIEFNLPEEAQEHQIFMQASRVHSVLYHLIEDLSQEIDSETHDKKTVEVLQKIKDDLWQSINDNQIEI